MTWLTDIEYLFHKWPRICSTFLTRLTRRVPLAEQELLTLPEHVISPPVFRGVRVTRFAVLCVMLFVLFLLAIVLSVLLRYTDFHYPFGIFKLLLPLSLDCPFLIASAVFSNAYLDIYSDLHFQHYPPFFSVQWVKIRGDFSFCRYWWGFRPSLLKLSFLNCHRNKENGKITLSPWKKLKKDEDTIIYTTSKLAKQADPGL